MPTSQSNDEIYWSDRAANSMAMGCATCPEYRTCGGIFVAAPIFDCSHYCRCTDATSCNALCRINASRFVRLYREVGGFEFDNVRRTPVHPIPSLPTVVPVIFNGARRDIRYEGDTVALPLFKLLDRRTQLCRFPSKAALARHFMIAESAVIVASGTGYDKNIEAWWQADAATTCATSLKAAGIDLVTTPNFSTFSDVPRQDNLHNMKRIALSFSDLINAGLPTALHINARTEADYQRWTRFVSEREEVQALAIEFATGAGSRSRMPWHINQLKRLSAAVTRRLTLLMRGGDSFAGSLSECYSVVLLDTDAFIKTHKRRKATPLAGRIHWAENPTPRGRSLHELLAHNIATVTSQFGHSAQHRGLDEDVHDDTRQRGRLHDFDRNIALAVAANEDSVSGPDPQMSLNLG